MNELIGKKIRELRIKMNMTQSELAGTEMTKGMLSHIENGLAYPSMKNLQYLAQRLNKPVSYFLEERDSRAYKEVFCSMPGEGVLQALNIVDEHINNKEHDAAIAQIDKLLITHRIDEDSIIYADISSRKGICLLRLGQYVKGEYFMKLSCDIFIKYRLYVEAVKCYTKLIAMYIEKYEYNAAMALYEIAWELYNKSTSRDAFVDIELLLFLPAIYVSQGKFDEAIYACERALAVSNINNIYYHSDQAYRLMAVAEFLRENTEQSIPYIEKAIQFAEFTENSKSMARICHNYALFENKRRNPEKALKYLELYEKNTKNRPFYYYLEVAKAKYMLGQYDEAHENILKIDYSEKIAYMLDCIYILEGKIYEGLIQAAMGSYEAALASVNLGVEKIKDFCGTEYSGFRGYARKMLRFAFESLGDIYSAMGDFERAYWAVKQGVNAVKG